MGNPLVAQLRPLKRLAMLARQRMATLIAPRTTGVKDF
jgi:hypothetical protein